MFFKTLYDYYTYIYLEFEGVSGIMGQGIFEGVIVLNSIFKTTYIKLNTTYSPVFEESVKKISSLDPYEQRL